MNKQLILALIALLASGPSWSAESDLYNFSWLDPEKKVYVLQNKIYKKQGTFYLNLGFFSGQGGNSNYQDVVGGHFSLGYYLFEEWAIEIFAHAYSNSDNENKDNLIEITKHAPFIRNFNSKMGGMLLWSPFYGKINTFNKILYFDWSLGLGGGTIAAESNAKTAAEEFDESKGNNFDAESFSGIFAKTALRIYIDRRYHAGIEYHWDMYQGGGAIVDGQEPKKKLRHNREVVFLAGISF